MSAERFQITREFDNGRTVSLTLAGPLGLDDVIDAFRGLLVQMGYASDIASRLDLREDDSDG